MGTPEDIQKIMDAGYKDRLSFTIWTDEKRDNMPLPTIAPILGPNGCVFQNAEGLCDLHASGLKPTEGKLAIHDTPDDGLRRTVGYTWISEEGIQVFKNFGSGDEKMVELIREAIPFVKQGRIEKIG